MTVDKREKILSEEQRQDLASKLSDKSSELYEKGIANDEKELDIKEKIQYDLKETTIEAFETLYEDFLNNNTSQKEVLENNKWKFTRELKQNLPPLALPSLADFSAVSPKLRACVSAGGALYGGLLFGLIFRFFLGEGLAGVLLGACLFTWFFTYAAEDKNMQDQLGKIIKIIIATTVVKFIIGKIIPKLPTLGKVWIPGGRKNSLAPLLIVIFPWIIIKIQQEGFEERRCRYLLNNIYLNWLSGVKSTAGIIVDQILSEDRKETTSSEDDAEKRKAQGLAKNLDNMIKLLLSTNVNNDHDRVILLKDLNSMASEMGYSRPENPLQGRKNPEESEKLSSDDNISPPRLQWRKNMEEHYKKYGLIEEEDEIEILDEPLLKEGVVVKKGMARKRRGEN